MKTITITIFNYVHRPIRLCIVPNARDLTSSRTRNESRYPHTYGDAMMTNESQTKINKERVTIASKLEWKAKQ